MCADALESAAIPPGVHLQPNLNLAASWYIALRSRDLKNKPKAIDLFGRPLVAWRDMRLRPVLMPRTCPHMGASLADGKVVDGCLRCPFHDWRFDSSGKCVKIPGVERIPPLSHLRSYPTVERYSYIWAWYGSAEPMFPLPEMPALDATQSRARCFRFADSTATSVRRILENTVDPDHLAALHGLEVDGSLTLRVLSDPSVTRDHGPPIAHDAWFGAELRWPSYAGKLGAVTRLLGTNARQFTLRVDGWPSGQRISYGADGVLQYRLLLATTPVAPDRTIQHIAVAVEKTGRLWRDHMHYILNRIEITFASKQDLPIFNTIQPGDRNGVYTGRDIGVLRFRKYYQSWVKRVISDA
jgi:phenylpropionate dioxygenase-like ring-hydroxylating dioxygenase large terminal subunit